MDSGHDDPFAGQQAFLDHPHPVLLLALADQAPLHQVLAVDDKQVASGLIGADGTFGHQKRVGKLLYGHTHPGEQSGKEYGRVLGVGENAAQLKGPRAGVELGVREIHLAFMGVTFLVSHSQEQAYIRPAIRLLVRVVAFLLDSGPVHFIGPEQVSFV